MASRPAPRPRSRNDRIDPHTSTKTDADRIHPPRPMSLSTAKFKNHPLDQVCCAYGTGLCTEHTPEKGPGGHGGRGRKLKEHQSTSESVSTPTSSAGEHTHITDQKPFERLSCPILWLTYLTWSCRPQGTWSPDLHLRLVHYLRFRTLTTICRLVRAQLHFRHLSKPFTFLHPSHFNRINLTRPQQTGRFFNRRSPQPPPASAPPPTSSRQQGQDPARGEAAGAGADED